MHDPVSYEVESLPTANLGIALVDPDAGHVRAIRIKPLIAR